MLYSAPMNRIACNGGLISRGLSKIRGAIALLCLAVSVFGADYGSKVVYDGGSIPEIKNGIELQLLVEANRIRLRTKDADVITIPAAAITEISYGQDVHRRIGSAIALAAVSLGVGAIMLLSKSKKHFIGITWAVGETKGGFAFQCDKKDYRGILAGLEGITGKKAVDSAALTVKN